MRKTIKVEELKDRVNAMILHLPDEQKSGREVLQTVIEQTLMNTGNYKGFRYLDKGDMHESCSGTTVGINGDNGDNMEHTERFADTDHTRVKYY